MRAETVRHVDNENSRLWLDKLLNIHKDVRVCAIIDSFPECIYLQVAHPGEGFNPTPLPILDAEQDSSAAGICRADHRLPNFTELLFKMLGIGVLRLAFETLRHDSVRRTSIQALEERSHLSDSVAHGTIIAHLSNASIFVLLRRHAKNRP
jgi:hypothetical protein